MENSSRKYGLSLPWWHQRRRRFVDSELAAKLAHQASCRKIIVGKSAERCRKRPDQNLHPPLAPMIFFLSEMWPNCFQFTLKYRAPAHSIPGAALPDGTQIAWQSELLSNSVSLLPQSKLLYSKKGRDSSDTDQFEARRASYFKRNDFPPVRYRKMPAHFWQELHWHFESSPLDTQPQRRSPSTDLCFTVLSCYYSPTSYA